MIESGSYPQKVGVMWTEEGFSAQNHMVCVHFGLAMKSENGPGTEMPKPPYSLI